MKCYNCGSVLTNDDFCTGCGADVRLYRQIIRLSNTYYNEGLEKAQVRDLTGAIQSLRQSLKCNRNHIQARNLLGLIYYEMGDVVPALTEWVISRSLRSRKNIADDFLNEVQSNPARLDLHDQTIRKYNQALSYARHDDLDLAVIQLKKVVSMNPNMVSGFLLLGLLYLKNEQWNKAKRTLEKVLRIDHNNTQALLYLKEAEERIAERDEASGRKRSRQKEEAIVYQSGNETIIQPLNGAETTGRWTILNILMGLALGMGVMWFLILPSRVQAAKSEISLQLKEVSEELTTRSADMEELNRQIEALKGERENAREELDAFTGQAGILNDYNSLLEAARSYLEDPEDALTAAGYLEEIRSVSENRVSDEFQSLYTYLDSTVSGKAAEQLKESGISDYDSGKYESAAESLEQAFALKPEDDEILYYLAMSQEKSDDSDRATELFHQLMDSFPDSEYRSEAEAYLKEGTEEESAASSTGTGGRSGTGTGASGGAAAAQTPAQTPAAQVPSVPEIPAVPAEPDPAAAALEAAAAAAAAAAVQGP